MHGAAPDKLQLALRGSGQALYVGLAEDAYIVASEPYGVVEETAEYVRMDGETPGNPENPNASRGQIIELDGDLAGTVDGMLRKAYDGTGLAVAADDVAVAQITTRDIDRGDHPHYLMKEIGESPTSFRDAPRQDRRDRRRLAGLARAFGDPRRNPRTGSQRHHTGAAIGQGTAAVAGQALAAGLDALTPNGEIEVEAVLATELSGFRLRPT